MVQFMLSLFFAKALHVTEVLRIVALPQKKTSAVA